MASPTVEAQVREFIAAYPTPNCIKALAYAEQGIITWEELLAISVQALRVAIDEVKS